MKSLSKEMASRVNRKVKVLQFGEGNFLRAFVDYMIDVANDEGVFDGNIAIVKPIAYGNLDTFRKQDNFYTVSLRGKEDGEVKEINKIITSVSDVVGAIEEYERYSEYAKSEDLRFIVSNTTEAGIVYNEKDKFELTPPETFPGKLTKLLYERFNHFNGAMDKGLVMIPCELIENNGKALRECVLKFASLWNLGDEFMNWVQEACIFCSTLVDRIVTGYPKDEPELFEKLGYQDDLLVTGEIFGLWVIESNKDISDEFPLHKANLPVIFTNDQRPYRERKVRILNGAHTSFVLASYLAGNDYVLESMKDEPIRNFMLKTIHDEIIPTLSLDKEQLVSFADSVVERFENPYIKHALLSISLNSVSKWKARCLSSFKGYVEKFSKLPENLSFSLAALIAFYSGKELKDGALIGYRNNEPYKILDDEHVLNFFAEHSSKSTEELVTLCLGNTNFWGMDLNTYDGLNELVTKYLKDIKEHGMRETVINLGK